MDQRDRDGKYVMIRDGNGKIWGQPGYIETHKQTEKYFKNRHFFIDPFELTIAQWCYAKGWNTQAAARSGLASASDNADFNEMRRSYFKYLQTFEPTAWGDLVSTWSITTSDVPDEMVDELVAKDATSSIYNPLEDTRPYYYATYQNVRGTSQLYQDPEAAGASYVNTEKGDEFQINSRTGGVSFMDILNQKTVLQTQRRIYGNGDYEGNRSPYDPDPRNHQGLLDYYRR